MVAAHRRSLARHGRAGLGIALVLVVAGCGGDDTDAASLAGVMAYDWVLDVEPSTPEVAPTAGAVTLSIDEDEVRGTGPCNGFRATFTIDDGEVGISGVAQSSASCGDEIDQAESVFFGALAAVDEARFQNAERLVLRGDDVELVFDAYDADTLIVGAWQVVNVATGDAIEGVPEGIEPMLVFADDGSLSVTGLCNTLGSTWALDGDQLVIDPVVSTMMACEPPELMAAESSIGEALGRVATVAVTPDTLIAYDADGLIVLVAAAADV